MLITPAVDIHFATCSSLSDWARSSSGCQRTGASNVGEVAAQLDVSRGHDPARPATAREPALARPHPRRRGAPGRAVRAAAALQVHPPARAEAPDRSRGGQRACATGPRSGSPAGPRRPRSPARWSIVQQLTIVTNALNIASELAVRPNLKLVVTGGVARPESYELVGPIAEASLEGLNLDMVFLGGRRDLARAGLTTHHEVEAGTEPRPDRARPAGHGRRRQLEDRQGRVRADLHSWPTSTS